MSRRLLNRCRFTKVWSPWRVALIVGVAAPGIGVGANAAGPAGAPYAPVSTNRASPVAVQPVLPATALASPTLTSQTEPQLDCLIEPNMTVELATSVSGIVRVVNVDRGDLIHTGQVLAQLEAEVERANVEHERARVEFTSKKSHRMQELLKEQMVSAQQAEEAKADYELAAAELRKSTEMLNQRTVFSPFNGVVVDRYVSPGELVDNTKKVLKVAQINPLNVEVIAPIAMLGEFALGGKMQVVPEGPVGGPFTASVRLVDRVVDAASGTFRVRLALPNPKNRISAGVRCKASLVKVAPPRPQAQNSKIATGKTPEKSRAAAGAAQGRAAKTEGSKLESAKADSAKPEAAQKERTPASAPSSAPIAAAAGAAQSGAAKAAGSKPESVKVDVAKPETAQTESTSAPAPSNAPTAAAAETKAAAVGAAPPKGDTPPTDAPKIAAPSASASSGEKAGSDRSSASGSTPVAAPSSTASETDGAKPGAAQSETAAQRQPKGETPAPADGAVNSEKTSTATQDPVPTSATSHGVGSSAVGAPTSETRQGKIADSDDAANSRQPSPAEGKSAGDGAPAAQEAAQP